MDAAGDAAGYWRRRERAALGLAARAADPAVAARHRALAARLAARAEAVEAGGEPV